MRLRTVSGKVNSRDSSTRGRAVRARGDQAAFGNLLRDAAVEAAAVLTPAQLRKVRDHEKRNANRKSVLQGIERKLK